MNRYSETLNKIKDVFIEMNKGIGSDQKLIKSLENMNLYYNKWTMYILEKKNIKLLKK